MESLRQKKRPWQGKAELLEVAATELPVAQARQEVEDKTSRRAASVNKRQCPDWAAYLECRQKREDKKRLKLASDESLCVQFKPAGNVEVDENLFSND